MSFQTQTVPVELEDGSTIYVKVDAPMGRRDVSGNSDGPPKSFERVAASIEGIVSAIAKPINAAKPTKASVTFAVEMEVQEGVLIAALAKGSATTSLEITLEWEKPQGQACPAPECMKHLVKVFQQGLVLYLPSDICTTQQGFVNNPRIDELLQQCTVKLSVPENGQVGTGFFIAPGYILTCEMVLRAVIRRQNRSTSKPWQCSQVALPHKISWIQQSLEPCLFKMSI